MGFTQFIQEYGLDAFTTVLGILYIILEYRASILLWVVGIVMPALDIYLYWSHGLYGDACMAAYYTIAAVYGYVAWKISERRNGQDNMEKSHSDAAATIGITHFKRAHILPSFCFFLAAWGITYFVLTRFTNSTVPLLDSFTNALSFVGLWALARKYLEQWIIWIIVDGISCYLYLVKNIPFKASLYGLYVVIAILGYIKWKRMMEAEIHLNK